MRFVNTVKSIIEAYKSCLGKNDISFGEYCYHLKPDKRNGRVYKDSTQIVIPRKEVAKIQKLSDKIS